MDNYSFLFTSFLENPSDEARAKSIREILDNIEVITSGPNYGRVIDIAIPQILQFLENSESYFTPDHPGQHVRKGILEILHRLPHNEFLRPHIRSILKTIFSILDVDNEENVLIALKIIIEIHKLSRPPFSPEVLHFLTFVNSVYIELPKYVERIFTPAEIVPSFDSVGSSNSPSSNLDGFFSQRTYSPTMKSDDYLITQQQPINKLRRGRNSLRVLQELPIMIVLMYQVYKSSVMKEVGEFIPIVIDTINIKPITNHALNADSSNYNKEALVEFLGAQVKAMSFIAYLIKMYPNLIIQHGDILIKGLINLLTTCPSEVAYLRRELFISARQFMSTELRFKFVPYMEKLLDDDVILGKGWTVRETLRPLAYSTLADLSHHIRQHLSIVDLVRAQTFFAYLINDESLPLSIQTMSCKVLYNLTDGIKQKCETSESIGTGREMLVSVLDLLVYKFKIIAKYHLPYFLAKYKNETNGTVSNVDKSESKKEGEESSVIGGGGGGGSEESKESKDKKCSFPPNPLHSYSFAESRSLLKTLVCGCKTISWGIASCKGVEVSKESSSSSGASSTDGVGSSGTSRPLSLYKALNGRETEIYIRLIKWGFRALDFYSISPPLPPLPPPPSSSSPSSSLPSSNLPQAQRTLLSQGLRSKEEKEIVEFFAGAFQLLNPYSLREILSHKINFIIERISENSSLQIFLNNLLATPATSSLIATVLVEFLLEKMHEIGENAEKSNLYLRIFKLIFGSVSLFPAENEQMLKPYLRRIVTRSMELALNATDPYNYFLLLRALFRSIGGGSHDLLYQEFLPLLQNLLQGLNGLQSGEHKQSLKDVFVELCLTVPVRLSSLLPFLPMLMDPLVSALNGSPVLVNQGLRTLELCVDNLQPDFLYEHIQPVRASLMQALWRILRSPNDLTCTIAYRILGKFGGSNRKMLIEPQKLDYRDRAPYGPKIPLHFPDHKSAILVQLERSIHSASSLLKSSTDSHSRAQAFRLIRTYLVSSLVAEEDIGNIRRSLLNKSLTEGEIAVGGPLYKCPDERMRKMHSAALCGLFYGAGYKEMRREVYKFLVPLVRHYAMVGVSMGLGGAKNTGMDPVTLFDSIATVVGEGEKEREGPLFFSLSIFMGMVIELVGTKERASSLPMIDYLTEKIIHLSYEQAWFTKLGCCKFLTFLLDHMSTRWALVHMTNIFKGMIYIMTDLIKEVSSGAVEAATSMVSRLVKLGVDSDSEPHLKELRESGLGGITGEMVRHLTSSVPSVQSLVIASLELLSSLTNKGMAEIIEPHMKMLSEMIPPRKHLIRHQPMPVQLGLLNGNSFGLSIEPKLFELDYDKHKDHYNFINEILDLGEKEEHLLLKCPCYKGVSNLVPVKVAILKVLACLKLPEPLPERVMRMFLKALSSTSPELQKTAYESILKFRKQNFIETDMASQALEPLLLLLDSSKTINMQVLREMTYLYQLSPENNSKIWELLLQMLRKLLESTLQSYQNNSSKVGMHDLEVIVGIISHFEIISSTLLPSRYLDPFCKLLLQAEKVLNLSSGSQLRPSMFKILSPLSTEFITMTFSFHITEREWTSFFLSYLGSGGEEGRKLRERMRANGGLIGQCLAIRESAPAELAGDSEEVQYFGVKVCSIMDKYDPEWLFECPEIVSTLRELWIQPYYHVGVLESGRKFGGKIWKEPLIVSQLLLKYFKRHPDDIHLLFSLLLAFSAKTISQFFFLKDFLENTVMNEYSVVWKRQVFFAFIEIFDNANYPPELKAKIIQFILIPCMSKCFERGQGDEFIGSPPMPETESPNNIISLLFQKVINGRNIVAQHDHVRIALCQLCCLIVEVASPHVHEARIKKQGAKLRNLMEWAWPCLMSKTCVDSNVKYYGHLLLSHIISKFAIHKRIVLQVFHSLLKAHVIESKVVIRQGLDILTPAMPQRMEDGDNMLIHWTKKILVEEGHSLAQLVHILMQIARHYKVYYPVRHSLVPHLHTALHRLGIPANSTLEHKKLAVELAEVLIKWELESMSSAQPKIDTPETPSSTTPPPPKSLERSLTDSVANFLIRMACTNNDSSSTTTTSGSTPSNPNAPPDPLARRCATLLKTLLKIDWSSCELKLGWLDKFLASGESAPQSICIALEILLFLAGSCTKEQVLDIFRGMQKGLSACLISLNIKILRATHHLMTKLMSLFPTEFNSTNAGGANKCEELEILYGNVSKLIFEALTNYEKTPNFNSALLQGPLMMLKSACSSNPCYIDKIITVFMKALQKLSKELLASNTNTNECNATLFELSSISMDLVKNRVGVMGVEMRKAFIGTVLVSLIDKITDVKVMLGILKLLEEWVKTKSPILVNQGPSSREKSILLVKMMMNVEKRFSQETDLVNQFLELIIFIYKDDHLKTTELSSKLEQAFLFGLRWTNYAIRKKFVDLFDASMKRKLHDRLLYILMTQNWEAMGPNYWIKQCIEILLNTALDLEVQITPTDYFLPGITYGHTGIENIALLNLNSRNLYSSPSPFIPEHEILMKELFSSSLDECDKSIQGKLTELEESFIKSWPMKSENIEYYIQKDRDFINSYRVIKVNSFIGPLVQLCHADTALAEDFWLNFFPSIWKIFSEKQQAALISEIPPFLCSGVHIIQKDCSPSVLNTFVEAMSHCVPPISLKPHVYSYLAKNHNLWHRVSFILEQSVQDSLSSPPPLKPPKKEPLPLDCYDFDPTPSPSSSITSSQTSSSLVPYSSVSSSQTSSSSISSSLVPSSSIFPSITSSSSVSSSLVPSSSISPSSLVSSTSAPPPPLIGGGGGVLGGSGGEAMEALCSLYSSLSEEDLWAGVWLKRAKMLETSIGIGFQGQGFYEKAQAVFEECMNKASIEFSDKVCPLSLHPEFDLWNKHWTKCSSELNQWESLYDISVGGVGSVDEKEMDPVLLLESSWRLGKLDSMKEALSKLETACPHDLIWKMNVYKGYLTICTLPEQNYPIIEKYIDTANQVCIREWKRLPHIVSNVHVHLLQAAQQIVELNEALQIHLGIIQGRTSTVHDMKSIVKTWKNRLPCISDDLSHWSDIFTWRQHHYQTISKHLDPQITEGSNTTNQTQTMLGVHASAETICHFGKIARKQNLTSVCLEALSKIYSIPTVPVVDCFFKIKQQVKCFIQQAQILGRNELHDALEIVESTNLKYFNKDMIAEFYTLKGSLLSQIGRSDEANKAFSASCQLNDNMTKTWGFWGDYLEGIFARDPNPTRNISNGISAVTSLMHACRHPNEAKARKYIAKILWLLTFDDEKGSLSDVVDKYSMYVPAIHWLSWVPQLHTLLVKQDGKMPINILNQVGRVYPQAVYFPIRTLYLTLKIEQRDKVKLELEASLSSNSPSAEDSSTPTPPTNLTPTTNVTTSNITTSNSTTSNTTTSGTTSTNPDALAIKATPCMWRCSRIMHMQRDLHPTVLCSLEGIVDQLVWFREYWHEEVLRQIKLGLAKCYTNAFENSLTISDAIVSVPMANFIRKLVATFGNVTGAQTGSAQMEAMFRRLSAQDQSLNQLKLQFAQDFDFSTQGGFKLHNLILKLKKWIKILELKSKLQPKSFLMQERFRFLYNFSTHIAEIELPGEFLMPKGQAYYHVKIARFHPIVEIVQKNNATARRILIRGHNGINYPYLIINDSSGFNDARREERVLQLERMLNHLLSRQKATGKRNLKFYVPKVVAVSPHMRLVEDNPASLSLLDVFKHSCAKRGIEYDSPIARYYEKIVSTQAKGSHVSHLVLREILKDVQTNLVPRTMMKEWATNAFSTPSDLWMFRKTFTHQLAVTCFSEYVFHLSRLNPEMFYLHQDSGMTNISYFRFELDYETETKRPVPFRLTPCISEFVTPFGVSGPMVGSLIALARCLLYPNYKLQALLRAILKDEITNYLQMKQKEREIENSSPSDLDSETVILLVSKSVSAIIGRLQSLSTFDGNESKATSLVQTASSHDNLCRMDPAWHPWL